MLLEAFDVSLGGTASSADLGGRRREIGFRAGELA